MKSNINARRVKLTFTDLEHQCMQLVAGKGVNSFLNNELHRFHRSNRHLDQIKAGKKQRKQVQHYIPDELTPFYECVAASFGLDVSTFVMRFIILPHISHTEAIKLLPLQEISRPAV